MGSECHVSRILIGLLEILPFVLNSFQFRSMQQISRLFNANFNICLFSIVAYQYGIYNIGKMSLSKGICIVISVEKIYSTLMESDFDGGEKKKILPPEKVASFINELVISYRRLERFFFSHQTRTEKKTNCSER